MAERVFVEIKRFKLDFNALANWRDKDHDGLPVYSVLCLYRAAGINDFLNEYNKTNGEKSHLNGIVSFDNLKVNEYTLRHIHNFIKENWEYFCMDLQADNSPQWLDGQKGRKRNHPHTLHAKVARSINFDFINYAPGVYEDDTLEDDVLIVGYMDDKVIEGEIVNETK